MRVIPYVAPSVGGAPVVVTRYELGGRDLFTIFGRHEITTKALDGGTYKVEVKVFGDDEDWYEIDTGVAQNKITKIDYAIEQIRISFAGMGGLAAPVIRVNSRPHNNFAGA